MTQYDLIHNMDVYQLAEWLDQVMMHCFNLGRFGECGEECPLYKCCNDSPHDNIESWLLSEAENEMEF